MRFIVLFLPLFAMFAMEFSYEQDAIYLLESDEIILQNSDLTINLNPSNTHDKSNKTIKTPHSMTSLEENLNFYHHSKKHKNSDDLMPLSKLQGGYTTRLQRYNDSFIDKNGRFRALQNCYILLKNTQKKIMDTKSSAVVLDLNSTIEFKNVKNSTSNEAYFGCFGDGRYIF